MCDPSVGLLQVHLGDVQGSHLSCGFLQYRSKPRLEFFRLLLAGDELQMLVAMIRRSSPCCSSVTWGLGRSLFSARSDPAWDSWGFFPVRQVVGAMISDQE